MYNNAAAPAVRVPHSFTWFDYDLSVGISFPGAYGGTDFNNRGASGDPLLIERTNRFLYTNVGAQVQVGYWGLSAIGDFLTYSVASPLPDREGVDLTLGRIHVDTAYGFFGNQLVIGGGARIALVRIDEPSAQGNVVRMVGAAPEAGLVVKPTDSMWRVGATFRAPVTARAIGPSVVDPQTQLQQTGGLVTPARITQPWEVEAGVAYQLGPRPLNAAWGNPRDAGGDSPESNRARFARLPREHVLLLAGVLMTGASRGAVSLEGFIDQKAEVAGRRVSVSPHVGLEAEPVPARVRLRGGFYVEPSRFDDGQARQHFTFGGDVGLFSWDLFGLVQKTRLQLGAFLDVAPRYQNFGFALGTWH